MDQDLERGTNNSSDLDTSTTSTISASKYPYDSYTLAEGFRSVPREHMVYEITDGSGSTHSSIESRDPYSVRTTSPDVTSLANRYQFYESERSNLAERMKGWTPDAIKAKLLYHWYGFGLWVNQANLSQPARRAARAENYEKRMARNKRTGNPVLCYINICQICGCGDWDYWSYVMGCLCPT